MSSINATAMNNAYMGIQTGFSNLEVNSAKIASPNVSDKADALVAHKMDANLVESSAKALKTADQMLGTIIDVMA